MTDNPRIDPDPSVLINTACTVVMAVCAFGTLALKFRGEKKRTHPDHQNGFVEFLRDGLSGSTSDVRKLIRFLAVADTGVADPIDRKFQFGETSLFLHYSVFGEFERISQSLIHNLEMVQKSVLHLVKFDPEWSVGYGDKIIQEITDFKERINGYYRGDLSNGEVLEDILLMLQTLEQLIGRMDTKN